MQSCNLEELSDYLEISYDCLPYIEVINVGFTVLFNVGSTREYVVSDTVVPYNWILMNTGGYYNSVIKAFICPVEGVYLFSTSIQTSSQNDQAAVAITVNTDYYSYTWADSTEGDDNDVATSVVTVDCKAGDRVWVTTRRDSYIYANYKQNLFSGVLISPKNP